MLPSAQEALPVNGVENSCFWYTRMPLKIHWNKQPKCFTSVGGSPGASLTTHPNHYLISYKMETLHKWWLHPASSTLNKFCSGIGNSVCANRCECISPKVGKSRWRFDSKGPLRNLVLFSHIKQLRMPEVSQCSADMGESKGPDLKSVISELGGWNTSGWPQKWAAKP